MDLENHSCGHIFCTFKANLFKLYVLVPIRLNRKLKVISRATCRVKMQFTRPNFSNVACLISHLVYVYSGERSRAIMALLYWFVIISWTQDDPTSLEYIYARVSRYLFCYLFGKKVTDQVYLKKGCPSPFQSYACILFGSTYCLVHITTNELIRGVKCWLRQLQLM